MKKLLTLLLFASIITTMSNAQNTPPTGSDSPLFPVFGEEFPFAAVARVDADGLMFKENEAYKLVLDMTDKISDAKRVYSPLARAARTYNLHMANGLSQDQFHMAIVIHSSALDAFFSNEAYKKTYGKDNPNLPVIQKMLEIGVELYVCGQNMSWRNLEKSQLAPGVKVALSAKTALVYFDHEGYMYMDIN
jgi:intracellular sulfur oxidation DsrE/DsrF family protein